MFRIFSGFNCKLMILLSAVLLSACGGSGDEYQGFDPSVKLSTPNKFLTFFNRQGDLAAGSYTLVVATAAAGVTDSFSVLVTRSDGSTSMLSGNWVSSGGQDSDPACAGGNRCFPIDLQDASGATFTLDTAADGFLYLVDDSGTPSVVASANKAAAGATETLKFSESEVDETAFAEAYYRAVDPGNARDTAQKYKALHGLDNPDVHVIFRDSKDLGYGRDMYMRSYANTSCGGQMTVFFVRNFSVKIIDGFAYGPVNLEGAIEADLQHNFGHNAIEFGLGRADVGDTCSTEPMAKFYTFKADYSTPGADHPRLSRIDLDARGAKAMPQPCISCHGGKLRPLDRNGDFVAMHAEDPANQIGDTKSRMQAFEVDTFEFSEKPGHTRADYEEGLRKLNLAIFCTYPGSDTHAGCAAFGGGVTAQANAGEWSGDFGREMMLGWYGDNGVNNALSTVGSKFSYTFVPVGWRPKVGGPPVGAGELFTKVVGPNCFVCHGKRGTQLGSDTAALGSKDLDFSSWTKFISHADEIERLVYDEGKMPLGLLNYDNFWGDPEKGELLASFIAPYVSNPTGFTARRSDSSGNIILPGRIVARAGPDRVTKANEAITLNAQATLFADSYQWSLISSPPGGEDAVLSSPNAMRSSFKADTDGDYVVQLTATSSEDSSQKIDQVTVKVDSGLATAPRDLAFYSNIVGALGNCTTNCHAEDAGALGEGRIKGIPVWWTENQPFSVPPAAAFPQLGFYEQVLARVNLEVIEDSLILKKPSRVHHYGGKAAQDFGFNLTKALGDFDRANYDMFVNWIAEGAPCGTGVSCP